MKTIQANETFSILKSNLYKIKNSNSFYFFMGMLTMAYSNDSISKSMYDYLYEEATQVASTVL